jgi:TonB family protein
MGRNLPDVQPEMKTNSPSSGGVYEAMKNVSLFARIVSLLALGATAPLAFGLTTTKTYIDSYRGRTDIPVPVKIVEPDADPSLAGARVEVEFVVDATGKPQNVHVVSATDYAFGTTVRDAVTRWKFAPARPSGTPVAMTVLLPVVVVESE